LAGGGAERVMSTLLANSEAERAEVDFSLALLDRETIAYPPPAWLPVHQLDCGGRLLASAKAVRTLIREQQPDVTLSFLTRANLATIWASRGAGAKAIASERVNTSSHLGSGPRGWASKALVRFTYPRADRIIAVSQGVSDDLQTNFGVRSDRLVVIDNPLDLEGIRSKGEATPSIPIDGPFVMAMGRLTPNKNFALVVEAFARSGAPGRLLILGQGPERDRLRRLGDALGLGERLVMPGFAENPFALLKRAWAFVLPSNAEGFPNSLVEAMALGRPVISTNCSSGPAEILAERSRADSRGLLRGPHGILVDPGSVDQMAEALNILQNPATCSHYSDAARSRAEDFSVDLARTRYWKVIRSVLGANEGNG
jgi:glycosyltransferase involved in cell wall biosynthesis